MALEVESFWDVVLLLALAVAVAPWFGAYLGKVYMDRPLPGDVLLTRLESGIYRLLGTSPRRQMAAREYMLAILLVNGGMLLFMFWFFFDQANLPLNPTGVPNMTWDLAFHSASSFTTNTNFTHFTNESQVSFGSLDIAWQLALFLSAATGLCVMAAMVRGFVRKDGTLGNYYVDMVRSISRVLLPVSIVGAIILVVMGVPETWSATVIAHPITGGTQTIYLGPVASWQTISLVGSNGGGWYSANMASPLANPSAVSNLYAVFLMLLLAFAAPFAFAQIIRQRSEAWPLIGSVLIVLVVAFGLFVAFQAINNPALSERHGPRSADEWVPRRPGDAVQSAGGIAVPGGQRLRKRRREQHGHWGNLPRGPDGAALRDVYPEHPGRGGRWVR